MNPKDAIDQYAKLQERAAELQAQQPTVVVDSSEFFRNKPLKTVVIGDDEDPSQVVTERSARRSLQRQSQVSKAVEDALVNRVQPPTGMNVMKVNFNQFVEMRKDPKFQSFAQYAHNITHYTNGKPRSIPLRPFIENEVGMYRDHNGTEHFVVIDRMPDDSARGDIPYVQVPVKLEAEKDPFPAPAPAPVSNATQNTYTPPKIEVVK